MGEDAPCEVVSISWGEGEGETLPGFFVVPGGPRSDVTAEPGVWLFAVRPIC